MRFVGSCLVLAVTFLLPNEAVGQQNSTFAATARINAIPFHLGSGFLIEVEGGIGQLNGLKFILDTGATHSVIDRRIARRFPLILSHKQVFNFDRFVGVDWAEFANVRLGPIEVQNISMMVSDLGKSSELVGDADAIIGLDLLTKAATIVIYYDSNSVALVLKDAQRASERSEPPCFAIEALLQGYPVRLLLDTGMAGIVLYEDRIRKRNANVRLMDARDGARLGRLKGKTARLPGFRLGARELNAEVFLMNGPRADQLPGIDGFLGTSPLNAKRVELDFERRIIRWQ